MKFCKNCGEKLNGDERFCGKCGEAIEEQNLKDFNNRSFNKEGADISIYFKESICVCKDMLVKPIDTIQTLSERLRKESTYILFLCLSLVYALIGLWGIAKVADNIEKSVFGALAAFGGLGRRYGSMGLLDKSKGKIFFMLFLIFIISVLIVFLISYLLAKYVFHKNVDYRNVLNVAVCASIPLVASLLCRNILMYIGIEVSMIFPIIGVIILLIALFKGMSKELNIEEDKYVVLLPITIVIMILVVYPMFKKML